jgi:cysteine desulfurase / selenocysteine lyase
MNASRRTFMRACGAVMAVGTRPSSPGAEAWRSHFPALTQAVNGHPLVYLDTAATALRPVSVTRALVDYYQTDNANPGHGGTLHTLARRSGERYEAARSTAARFVNAADPAEIVWTRGTTDAINLVAAAWGSANLERGDEILTTVAEHYSNLLPWQHLARRTGAKLRHLDIHDRGRLRIEDLDRLLTSRTKLVAFSHVSNVLGLVVDAKPICRRAHQAGAVVLIDGAQSAPHLAIDVQNLECDFFAFSSHKMFGPMGMGVLWARRSILERMPPYQSGANMAHDADLESARYADLPFKFQAGTANVAGPVGLAAAIDFMAQAKRDGLEDHEKTLGRHLVNRLSSIRRVNVAGSVRDEDRIPLITFSVDGVPAADIVMAMDAEGIAVRGGDMAALPLLKRLGRTAAVRASLSVYNTIDEIDRFADTLEAFLQKRVRH